MRDLSRLLRPRSIAVVGGEWARGVVAQCQKIGFAGEIWPVHPQQTSVCGLRCYPNLAALPAVPDASFLAINRRQTVAEVASLAALQAGGAMLSCASLSCAPPVSAFSALAGI